MATFSNGFSTTNGPQADEFRATICPDGFKSEQRVCSKRRSSVRGWGQVGGAIARTMWLGMSCPPVKPKCRCTCTAADIMSSATMDLSPSTPATNRASSSPRPSRSMDKNWMSTTRPVRRAASASKSRMLREIPSKASAWKTVIYSTAMKSATPSPGKATATSAAWPANP